MLSEKRTVALDPSWFAQLGDEFDKPYMQALRAFLLKEKEAGKTIFPAGAEYFNALNTTPFEQVRVVILGQDPYHGPGQAHGLCFSVKKDVPLPPSLKNIYKEIQDDLGLAPAEFASGCLLSWARQGVLLLNSVLTVEQHQAASHQGKGWETFTDRVIETLSARPEPCVFLLWGSYAQKKGLIIDSSRHKVLKAPHPSPLSAHRGFFGCRHFSACNQYLQDMGSKPVNWRVED